MQEFWQVFFGLLIPLLGTTLGAAMVFFLKDGMNDRVKKVLLGFAAGVMIAASIWSLLDPSINLAVEAGWGKWSWVPAAIGFLLGVGFLLLIDYIVLKVRPKVMKRKNIDCSNKYSHKNMKLFMAVTIHNIPEGMAVGVMFAGMLSGSSVITFASAMVLSIGMAIQNFPEGGIVSMPLGICGEMSKKKAFAFGTLSGVVEPIAAVLAILLLRWVNVLLPYFLSFAAGVMIYVVI
ncbi:MAG: ZIP family metal transporter, partial [Bacilli bacterium]